MGQLSFASLQRQLQPHWGRLNAEAPADVDVLLVPSLSLERSQMELVTGAHHYEERQLFSLVRLRHPGVRMVYATSKPLAELVVDAVLELLPGVPTSHARRRLHLFDTDDASDRPLTAKLLERPALLSRIGELLRPGRSFISCFVVSDLERQLSERLQVPLLGCDPALAHWGSKAGSRELFARCDVPHPPGSTLVHSLDDLAEACAELWETHPQLQQLVVKLNEGFSGEGNARLALAPLQLAEHGAAERRRLLRQALEQLPMPAPRWRELVAEQGALAEAWLEGGEALSSPSVQGTIHPGAAGPGTVELLSSHEQVLGGPDGQTYQGCSFPAAGAYRAELLRHGRAVGVALAAAGALERFAVDFIALAAITGGASDGEDGLYRAPTGTPLYYRATDTLQHPGLRGLLPVDLIDIVAEAGLHFDPAQLRGSVFHLLGCLSEFGKLGMTCIGRSAAEAEAVYSATERQLVAGAARLAGR